MLPTFIISGVARCGTTSLYYYLKQHPEIGFPPIKEPKFFSSKHLNFPHNGIGDKTVDAAVIKDYEKYISLFSKLDMYKMIGEASSDYVFYHQYTVPEVQKSLGDIPIIISIRNPIDRAFSAYKNMIRDGREPLNFLDALNEEENRLNNNWDWMWAYKTGGLYSEAIEHYMESFSQVKIILFDDIVLNTKQVIKDILKFLGVDQNVIINVNTKYSHSGRPKNVLVAKLMNRESALTYYMRQTIFKIVPRSILENISDKLLTKDELSEDIHDYLTNYYQNDIGKLETLLNIDLTKWRTI